MSVALELQNLHSFVTDPALPKLTVRERAEYLDAPGCGNRRRGGRFR